MPVGWRVVVWIRHAGVQESNLEVELNAGAQHGDMRRCIFGYGTMNLQVARWEVKGVPERRFGSPIFYTHTNRHGVQVSEHCNRAASQQPEMLRVRREASSIRCAVRRTHRSRRPGSFFVSQLRGGVSHPTSHTISSMRVPRECFTMLLCLTLMLESSS